MGKFVIKQLALGAYIANCYVIYHEEIKEAIIIDPGSFAGKIKQELEALQVKPAAILLTHGHFDHIMAADALRELCQIPIYAHRDEQEMLTDPAVNFSARMGAATSFSADIWLNDGDLIDIAGLSINVIHTPGHTPGGVCYYLEEEKVLFSGDTLFRESLGRTDFPKSSTSKILSSIREKLLTLPEEVTVYPGHEDETTIAHERRFNPVNADL